jgi:hypothetical protein
VERERKRAPRLAAGGDPVHPLSARYRRAGALDDHTIPPTQPGLTRPYLSRNPLPQAVLFDLDDTLADRSAAIKVYASAFATDHADVLLPCAVDDVHQALILADDF